MTELTAPRLREIMNYDPATGVFRYLIPTAQRTKVGAVAGGRHAVKGYWYIKVDGRTYFGHRLAWLYTHGEWPPDQIDHIDRDRCNNRLANLRIVTSIENSWNRTPQRGGSSVYPGVSFHKRIGRWQANIRVRGVLHHVGYFDVETDARDARAAMKARLHVIDTYEERAA